jgi:hypothetical protein
MNCTVLVKPRQQHFLSLIAYAAIVSIGSTGCGSHSPSQVFVTTNQEYIEQVAAESVDLEDVRGMFARIFATLPEEVTIYPTENYYYFKLFTNHREIWGNMRLDHQDRDRGILDFAYFEVHGLTDPYFNFSRSWYKPLASEDGVVVQKQDPFTYTVTADGRTVTFHLNQLEQIVPSGIKLRPDEVFISRNCDESGFQFILIFDQKRRAFRFLLDESVPLPDLLQPFGRDVFVGMRSGFAFYHEPDLGRKLLFGVDARNVEVNNYFDGPFDQLGDNFIDPEKFEEYVTLAYPFYRGKIKGRGDFIDEKGQRTGSRVLISAYFSYTNLRDLWVRVASCLEMESDPVELSSCIGRDEKDPAYAYLREREGRTIKRTSRSSKKSR